MVNPNQKQQTNEEPIIPRIGLRRKATAPSYYSLLNSPKLDFEYKHPVQNNNNSKNSIRNSNRNLGKTIIKKEPGSPEDYNQQSDFDSNQATSDDNVNASQNINDVVFNINTNGNSTPETYLIDRYKYAVRHIKQGLSVEEACNKYRISKGALLKCLSGGTAPRGKKTRLTESEENEIVEWLINYKDLKYNDAIHLVFEQVAQKFEQAQRPNPFNNGKPSMDWWYDFLSRHPQIMASKPDWIMRGKVNDQYIKDVQSGQLKCTKFRRALLSAIQYIRSLNETINSSLSEASVCSQTQSDQNNNNINTVISKKKCSFKPINNQFKENNQTKILNKTSLAKAVRTVSRPSNNNKFPIDNLKQEHHDYLTANNQSNNYEDKRKKFRSTANKYCGKITAVNSNANQFINTNLKLNSNFPDDSVILKETNNKDKNYLNEHDENLSDFEEDEEETINNENNEDENNEANIDNVTFITEIFNSELENHNFDHLIDPNLLIEKDDEAIDQKDGDVNSYLNGSPIYDINPNYLNSSDYSINNHYKMNHLEQKENSFSIGPTTSSNFNNNILNSSSLMSSYSSKINYDQIYNHHHLLNQPQHQHLLVPDDDENE